MANEVRDAFNAVYIDGPSSDPTTPLKSEIRPIGSVIDTQIALVSTALNARVDTAEALAIGGVQPPKQSVRILMTTNVVIASALENGDTLDGLTLQTGNRVALTGQTAPAQNGVYVAPASGAAVRSTDMDASGEIVGASFTVDAGTHAAETWACSTVAPITVDTTALIFVRSAIASPTAAEVVAARGGEASLDARLDLMESRPSPEEYGVSIYKSDGIALGGYYAERSASIASTQTKLFAEVIAGDTGAEVEFYAAVNGSVTYGPATVVLGTPINLTGLSIAVTEGDLISFVVLSMSGDVTDFFAKTYGDAS